jgi:uncharacterized SAM-dependent methyltransferase
VNGAAELRRERPGLAVHPLAVDFTRGSCCRRSDRCVDFFPGSSIGNFDRANGALLARMVHWLDGGLLIGVDLVKDPICFTRPTTTQAASPRAST